MSSPLYIVSIRQEAASHNVSKDGAEWTQVNEYVVKVCMTPRAMLRLLPWHSARPEGAPSSPSSIPRWRMNVHPPYWVAIEGGDEKEPHLLHVYVRDMPDELAVYNFVNQLSRADSQEAADAANQEGA